MSQQSLIIKYCIGDNNIVIFDVHNDHQLKTLGKATREQFNILDEAVRGGEVSFGYLLSDAVATIDDINIVEIKANSILNQLQGFSVGDPVIFNDREFVITFFNFSSKPITAEIEHEDTKFTVTLQSVSKAPEESHICDHCIHILELGCAPDTEEKCSRKELRTPTSLNTATELPITHYSLTMSPPADNEANKKLFFKGQKVYRGLIPYIFEEYLSGNSNVAYVLDMAGAHTEIPTAQLYIPQPEEKHTGGSSSYYRIRVNHPTTSSNIPYSAECNDIIEALEMTFAEANIFKAVWRTAAERQGKKKQGNNAYYDAEKIIFFGKRMLVKARGDK